MGIDGLCNDCQYDKEKHETWTVTIEATVFAGDMPEEAVKENAEELLEGFLDGTDFMNIAVTKVERD